MWKQLFAKIIRIIGTRKHQIVETRTSTCMKEKLDTVDLERNVEVDVENFELNYSQQI